ncbi:MAG: apolipoprotein N-acyltransferase [Elusimicrobia bacterium]|nr:apolipoprotein N-acyltransferase [Elusimicrobiota bacterium]
MAETLVGGRIYVRQGILSFLLVVVSSLWGEIVLHRAARLSLAQAPQVAILQGNIDQYKKWDAAYEQEIRTTYSQLALEAASHHPVLTVWPESAVPGFVRFEPALYQWLSHLVVLSGGEHLVGSVDRRKDLLNVAFVVDRQGHLKESYRKLHLVPFGEVVPFQRWLGRYIPVLNELGAFEAGHAPYPLMTHLGPIGTTICFEAIFPDLTRRFVRNGAQVLVNITNDGWFLKTAAPEQHLIMNVFRAIENRRTVVRAANTGISAGIDPWGRFLLRTQLLTKQVGLVPVVPQTHLTFYTRFGDLFAQLCSATTIMYLFLWYREKRAQGAKQENF